MPGSTADFALAASIIEAFRVLARDVLSEDGTPLLGWELACAVADDATFPLMWPSLLASLLEEDRSPRHEATCADSDRLQG